MGVEVIIAWDPNKEPDLAGYRIYWGTSSRTYASQKEVTDSTICTISGLQEGMTYYFAATAFDIHGNESGFSAEITYTVPLEPIDGSYESPADQGEILDYPPPTTVEMTFEANNVGYSLMPLSGKILFDISGITGTVQEAYLNLYSVMACSEIKLYFDDKLFCKLTSVPAGSWNQINVSELISTNGTYDFTIYSWYTSGFYSYFDANKIKPFLLVAVVPAAPDGSAPSPETITSQPWIPLLLLAP